MNNTINVLIQGCDGTTAVKKITVLRLLKYADILSSALLHTT